MRHCAWSVVLVLGVSGCISVDTGPERGYSPGGFGAGNRQPHIPGVQGPHGQSVPMQPPYSYNPPASEFQARQLMKQSQPLSMVQINHPNAMMQSGMTAPGAMPPQLLAPPGGLLSPVGVPAAPGMPANPMAPFAQPGGGMPPFPPMAGGKMPFPPGRGMPFPPGGGMPFPPGGGMPPFPPNNGVMQAKGGLMDSGLVQASYSPDASGEQGVAAAGFQPGAMAAMGAIPPSDGVRFSVQRTQVRFMRPSGMKIAWFTRGADGQPAYSSSPIEAPGRYNFQQGAVYRLKLSNIEGRPGLEVYPTLEVVSVNVKTEAFLAHSSVPIDFTDEDFNQITQGNFVVKVVYLPDSQYQEFAGTGIDTILSTQLEPGADPIKEALRRGSILLIVRMGNVDQEAPNTPGLGDASGSGQNANVLGAFGQGNVCPPPMVPYILPGMQGMMPPSGMMPQPGMMPPNFMVMPPADPKGKDPEKKDAALYGPASPGPMMSMPGSGIPDLMTPPSRRMVGGATAADTVPPPPKSSLPITQPPVPELTPNQVPGTLTGQSTLPDMPPEIGPPPTPLPEGGQKTPATPPESAFPEDLLNALPPAVNSDANGLPPSMSPMIDSGLPPPAGVSVPPPPRDVLDGPPAMLPPTDPGQELQRIGGTTPR